MMAVVARLRHITRRARNIPRRLRPRFWGAYADRAAALAALPGPERAGYDDPDVAAISFEAMCRVKPWDYPVLFWLSRLIEARALEGADARLDILDAGGHMGTKYIAFGGHLDLSRCRWTVLDLPEVVRGARLLQASGRVPAGLRFTDDAAASGRFDVLLMSGLLQYLDCPFGDYLARLPRMPAVIILNKVALRDGAGRFTLEQIGPHRVPYQIRDRAVFEAEIAAAGYHVRDVWDIPALGHRIPLYPHLGRSQSAGYLLERATHMTQPPAQPPGPPVNAPDIALAHAGARH